MKACYWMTNFILKYVNKNYVRFFILGVTSVVTKIFLSVYFKYFKLILILNLFDFQLSLTGEKLFIFFPPYFILSNLFLVSFKMSLYRWRSTCNNFRTQTTGVYIFMFRKAVTKLQVFIYIHVFGYYWFFIGYYFKRSNNIYLYWN